MSRVRLREWQLRSRSTIGEPPRVRARMAARQPATRAAPTQCVDANYKRLDRLVG
jgi:hypothetical protein